MILNCNSCEKKFIVPDNAIGTSGRLVQCSSCGNKWKQFPITIELQTKTEITEAKSKSKAIKKTRNKQKIKKRTGPALYSPEYLAKKHGIQINGQKLVKEKNSHKDKKTNIGFYSSLIILIITAIFILRILFFTQDIIVEKFPFFEVYIDYLFESIINIKEIVLNFFNSY